MKKSSTSSSMAFQYFLLCLILWRFHFVSGTTIKAKLIPLQRDDAYRASKINGDIRSPLAPEPNSCFAANISIGEPPVPQMLLIDTGSHISWLECYPCDMCTGHPTPHYYPSKSSTYTNNVACASDYCRSIPGKCDDDGKCLYRVDYVDQSYSVGRVGMDKLRFTTSDEGITSISNMAFGCATRNDLGGTLSGILGLGFGYISVVHQLDCKSFSYCLGSITDQTYGFNQLILGDGAKLEGDSTPMVLYGGKYYLTIEGIRIGDKQLAIDQKMFSEPSQDGGVLIDSGATLTYLTRGAYELVSAEVQNLMDGILIPNHNIPRQLCYNGVLSKDLIGFPVLAFQFAEGAELVLPPDSLFYQKDVNLICMAIVMSETEPWMQQSQLEHQTVIGIQSQQYYNIGFDLARSKLYLQFIDCELLED